MSERAYRFCLVGRKYNNPKGSKQVQLIGDAAKKLGVEITNISVSDLQSRILNNRVEYFSDKVDIASQDAFIFRGIINLNEKKTGCKVRVYPEFVQFARYVSRTLGKVVMDEFLLSPNTSFTKFTMGTILAERGVAQPDSWLFMTKDDLLKSVNSLPFPIIVKPADGGGRGVGVMRFDSPDKLVEYVKANDKSGLFYPNMCQACIENDGDYRVVVLGDKVVVALKKSRAEGSVVANMSQGNTAQPVEDPELNRLAIDAANALNIEFAGVDIIEDINTKKRYVLEVNLSPQIYLSTQFGGVDIAAEMIKYLMEKVDKNR